MLILLAFLGACAGGPLCQPPVVLEDEDGYHWSGGVSPSSLTTAEQVDVHFDWSLLTADLSCQPLDPVADLDAAWILGLLGLTAAEGVTKLLNGSLMQQEVSGFADCVVGEETACDLSDFEVGGTAYFPVSDYTQAGGPYLFMLAGPGGFRELRYLAALDPTPESAVVSQQITPDCDAYGVTTDFGAGLTVPAPGKGTECDSASATRPVYWSALTTTGNGAELDPLDIVVVTVARYDIEVSELEAGFLDWQSLASEQYDLSVSGQTTADLADATSDSGSRFGGFSGSGFWLLVLDTQQGMMPSYATVIHTE